MSGNLGAFRFGQLGATLHYSPRMRNIPAGTVDKLSAIWPLARRAPHLNLMPLVKLPPPGVSPVSDFVAGTGLPQSHRT
jgi:hypothetical protein